MADECYMDNEKLVKDAEQLKEMGKDSAFEVMRGYHKMLVENIKDCIEQTGKIVGLSPATTVMTETAIIIAQRDFADRNNDKEGLMAIVGGKDEVSDLLDQIWKKIPDVFEKLVESHGFVKAEEKSA